MLGEMKINFKEIVRERWVTLTMRLFLGGVFITAGVIKLSHLQTFVAPLAGQRYRKPESRPGYTFTYFLTRSTVLTAFNLWKSNAKRSSRASPILP